MIMLRLLPLVSSLVLLAACASSRSAASAPTGGGDSTNVYRIDQITVKTDNIELMVVYYEHVFGVRFKKLPSNGTYIYSARLFGVEMVFVPAPEGSERVGLGRYQFNVVVPDLDGTIRRAVSTGGTLVKQPRIGDTERSATVADPDGNTMVLVQKT